MKVYEPKINVLHVEDDPEIRASFRNALLERNIYFHQVDNLSDAKDVLKECQADVVIADGTFPTRSGEKETKNFIPLVNYLRKIKSQAKIVAWSDSTHVHEFCKKEGLSSFSKAVITRDAFKEKGREYVEVKVLNPNEAAGIAQEILWKLNGFSQNIPTLNLKEYYSEPSTVLALAMAYDMRTGLFEQTAGLNYGPVFTKISDGLFTGYIGQEDEAKISKLIYDKILNQNFFPKLKKNVYLRAKKLKTLSSRLRDLNYGNLSDKALAKNYLEFYETFMEMRMYSSLPTAMEHLTNPWTEFLTDILSKKIKDSAELNNTLSVLTSPEKPSYLNEYQVAAARIEIGREAGENVESRAIDLAKQYTWINYTFEGVPITQEDVMLAVQELKKSNPDLKSYVREFEERPKVLRREKDDLIEKYALIDREVEFFDIGAEIVFIKYFRKGIFAEAYYSVEFLLDEIGNRAGCSKKEVVQMFPNEALASLRLKTFPDGLIGRRLKASGMWGHSGMSFPLSIDSLALAEKNIIKNKLTAELKGQVAFVGKVTGTVKIVNTPADMEKLNRGEILVSRSTNPSLINAMQRAGAFVTDLGGLTCHAAIVAREMKKPCVVGTKIATKVLKDGDEVEVDADHGVVRIIKKME